MSESYFKFLQFTINQDRSAMKVSTDPVLLGSWADPKEARSILDIGTGTGVLAIMMAQKSLGSIDAIDIDFESARQARDNSDASPWGARINVVHTSLQDYAASTGKKYDLIISNPPYFENTNSKSANAKVKAKHTNTLSYSDLIRAVRKLLNEQGVFYVVLPSQEGSTFFDLAYVLGLYCREKLHVHTIAGKIEKRVLMKFLLRSGTCQESSILMQDQNKKPTAEFIELTKDYYPPAPK